LARPRTARIRWGTVLLAGSLLSPLPALSQDSSAAAEPERPLYLEGLDLALPTQELFRQWPSSELVERPYWLPWGGGALNRAALFNRPIFFVLDVNWSRAAAATVQGALADRGVLREVNRGFVSVRVNADMRPDVRERYRTGSWPTIAFLLPNGKPMLSRVNDQGVDRPITTGAVDVEPLLFLLREGSKYWSLVPDELVRRADEWSKTEGPRKPLLGVVEASASDKMAQWMLANADGTDGGFGAAPKFVIPGLVGYTTLRAARGADDLVDHGLWTLDRLVVSPLYDEIDGGIRRLAAAPDFGDVQSEKLLAGNATLVRELALSLRYRESQALREALRSTTAFVSNVLHRDGGGFYLAQVAAEPDRVDGAPPPVDSIVLAGPNAMAGAAMIRAAATLEDPELERIGLEALHLVRDRAFSSGRGVRHVIEPIPSTRQYLEALADTAFGFLDAYETTGDDSFLNAARAIADDAIASLDDPDSSAMLDHKPDAIALGLLGNPRRPLLANVRMARALTRLHLHGFGERYREAALGILGYFSGDLSGFRAHGIEAALGIEEAISEPLRIVVVGPAAESRTRELRRAAVNSPWPWTIVTSDVESSRSAARIRWRGRTVSVEDPAALHDAVRKMTDNEVEP